MGRRLMVCPETKNRAISHIRKGKYIQPETLWLERGEQNEWGDLRWGSPQKSTMEENWSVPDYKKWMWHTGVNFWRKGKGSRRELRERQTQREKIESNRSRESFTENLLNRKTRKKKFGVWDYLDKWLEDTLTDTNTLIWITPTYGS